MRQTSCTQPPRQAQPTHTQPPQPEHGGGHRHVDSSVSRVALKRAVQSVRNARRRGCSWSQMPRWWVGVSLLQGGPVLPQNSGIWRDCWGFMVSPQPPGLGRTQFPELRSKSPRSKRPGVCEAGVMMRFRHVVGRQRFRTGVGAEGACEG
jgi:hypothetical protein